MKGTFEDWTKNEMLQESLRQFKEMNPNTVIHEEKNNKRRCPMTWLKEKIKSLINFVINIFKKK